jgi:hypothetical protein
MRFYFYKILKFRNMWIFYYKLKHTKCKRFLFINNSMCKNKFIYSLFNNDFNNPVYIAIEDNVLWIGKEAEVIVRGLI